MQKRCYCNAKAFILQRKSVDIALQYQRFYNRVYNLLKIYRIGKRNQRALSDLYLTLPFWM